MGRRGRKWQFLTALYRSHSIHRHSAISRAIATQSSPLYIAISDRTQTKKKKFQNAKNQTELCNSYKKVCIKPILSEWYSRRIDQTITDD